MLQKSLQCPCRTPRKIGLPTKGRSHLPHSRRVLLVYFVELTLIMLQLVPQLRILLAVHPTDFRKGLDSLIALCRGPLRRDPFSGTLFVFRNRTGTALKLVVYDGIGFWLCVRRFSSGTLVWWSTADTPLHPLTAPQLNNHRL